MLSTKWHSPDFKAAKTSHFQINSTVNRVINHIFHGFLGNSSTVIFWWWEKPSASNPSFQGFSSDLKTTVELFLNEPWNKGTLHAAGVPRGLISPVALYYMYLPVVYSWLLHCLVQWAYWHQYLYTTKTQEFNRTKVGSSLIGNWLSPCTCLNIIQQVIK